MLSRKRRLLPFGSAAVLLALAALAWPLWPRTTITREHAAEIEEGMTLAEVETIMGGPAR